MLGKTVAVEEKLAIRTGLKVTGRLACLTTLLLLAELDSLKKVFGVVGLSSLSDVAFDGEIENRN